MLSLFCYTTGVQQKWCWLKRRLIVQLSLFAETGLTNVQKVTNEHSLVTFCNGGVSYPLPLDHAAILQDAGYSCKAIGSISAKDAI
jgi:hypothetical protein